LGKAEFCAAHNSRKSYHYTNDGHDLLLLIE
jgi:hypothetical protein